MAKIWDVAKKVQKIVTYLAVCSLMITFLVILFWVVGLADIFFDMLSNRLSDRFDTLSDKYVPPPINHGYDLVVAKLKSFYDSLASSLASFSSSLASLSSFVLGILAACLGLGASKFFEKWKKNESRLYGKRQEAYAKLMSSHNDLLPHLLNRAQGGMSDSASLLGSASIKVMSEFVLYSSAEVLAEYRKLQLSLTSCLQQGDGPARSLLQLSTLLEAMRKEAGHSWFASKLDGIELLSAYANLSEEEKVSLKGLSQQHLTEAVASGGLENAVPPIEAPSATAAP